MQLKSRVLALPLAAVLASGAFFHSAPAQAAPKSKLYKGGAIALGALGAYMLSKGKTVEGAAAIGAGVLAYKQGQKESNKEKYGSNYNDRYGRYDNGYDNGYYNNGGYNGNYNQPYYNGNATYNDRDYRYNNSGYGNNGNYNDDDCRDNNGPGRNGRGNAYGHAKQKNRSWQR